MRLKSCPKCSRPMAACSCAVAGAVSLVYVHPPAKRAKRAVKARHKASAQQQAARVAQGYEANPPQCNNCRFVQRRPAVCGIGHFLVSAAAVCDHWQSPTGETLEP